MIQQLIHTTTGTGTEYGVSGWAFIALLALGCFGLLSSGIPEPRTQYEKYRALVPQYMAIVVGALYLRYIFDLAGRGVLENLALSLGVVSSVAVSWYIKKGSDVRPPTCEKCGEFTDCETCGWSEGWSG